jgi:hypothetical protein
MAIGAPPISSQQRCYPDGHRIPLRARSVPHLRRAKTRHPLRCPPCSAAPLRRPEYPSVRDPQTPTCSPHMQSPLLRQSVLRHRISFSLVTRHPRSVRSSAPACALPLDVGNVPPRVACESEPIRVYICASRWGCAGQCVKGLHAVESGQGSTGACMTAEPLCYSSGMSPFVYGPLRS